MLIPTCYNTCSECGADIPVYAPIEDPSGPLPAIIHPAVYNPDFLFLCRDCLHTLLDQYPDNPPFLQELARQHEVRQLRERLEKLLAQRQQVRESFIPRYIEMYHQLPEKERALFLETLREDMGQPFVTALLERL